MLAKFPISWEGKSNDFKLDTFSRHRCINILYTPSKRTIATHRLSNPASSGNSGLDKRRRRNGTEQPLFKCWCLPKTCKGMETCTNISHDLCALIQQGNKETIRNVSSTNTRWFTGFKISLIFEAWWVTKISMLRHESIDKVSIRYDIHGIQSYMVMTIIWNHRIDTYKLSNIDF